MLFTPAMAETMQQRNINMDRISVLRINTSLHFQAYKSNILS
ncbi:hypothetical protein HMPREF0971_00428 [Segatella oris F0302]|uniref:Uncharacterized protein n=1 Tax=Segatella oris F0302 TaxID=649760 RepID=D1QN93_9BACT|nr:hypothetical protein HMPREF0971_00428 [Segatella oris F0302]